MKKFFAILLSTALVATMLVAMLPAASAAAVNVALGAPVACGENCKASDSSPASTVVTDGILPTEGSHWSTCYLIRPVDSGKYAWFEVGEFAATDISTVKFTFIKTSEPGFNPPYEPVVQFWSNGEWVGNTAFSDAPADAASLADGVYTYTQNLETPINATKVRIGFFSWAWICVGEVEVLGEGSAPETSTPETSTPEENKPSTSTKTVDVVAGLGYTLSGDGTSSWMGNITDGEATENLFDGTWVGVKDNNNEEGAEWVHVMFELDDVYTISGGELTYAIGEGGIGIPYEMHLQASMDGETWTTVGQFVRVTNEQGIQEVEMTDVVETEAKYVRVRAVNSGWWFIGELNVFAEVEQGSSSTPSTPSTPNTGDASSMVIFMVTALVAIAGTATVIKTRR